MRQKIRKFLISLKRQQLLGREGGYWPNMLVFWLLCFSVVVLIFLIYYFVNFREYPLYASYDDIQCHDATHIKSGSGRYGHVQIFDVAGEEIVIRGNISGSSGILYVDRMFKRDKNYHICFIRLQDKFLDDNSRLVGLWQENSQSKGELNKVLIESRIDTFNKSFILLIDIVFYPILFVVCFMIFQGLSIITFFNVSIFEKNSYYE